jgi:hypothetical protein
MAWGSSGNPTGLAAFLSKQELSHVLRTRGFDPHRCQHTFLMKKLYSAFSWALPAGVRIPLPTTLFLHRLVPEELQESFFPRRIVLAGFVLLLLASILIYGLTSFLERRPSLPRPILFS